MRYRQTISSGLFLAVALFAVTTSLLLFRDIEAQQAGTPEQVRLIVPYFSAAHQNMGSITLNHYPEVPTPGDFMIIEAGPVLSEPDYDLELEFDFPGVASGFYQAGDLIYAIIAISWDTDPGFYNLALRFDIGGLGSEIVEKSFEIAAKEFRLSRFSMPPSRTEGWTAERLAEDRENIRLAREKTEPYPLWLDSFLLPLEGRITSEYGAIRIINNNPPRRHSGLDIGAPEGTPVVSPNSGIVRLSGFLLSGGYTVIIDHGMDLSSTYMHLETIAVEAGQRVNRGEEIGTVGMTGYATGPHLHWEVNIGQTPVNPLQLTDNDLLWVAPAYVSSFIPVQP
jgi:murein DD-endopeptidase MepM/ murein hydrolase activator NlpD